MTALAENPRAIVGSNQAPDYAREVTDRMARDYEELSKSTTELLAKAKLLPTEVNDENLAEVSAMVVSLRDTAARAKAFHTAEKEPFLRGGQAVDQFFYSLHDRLARRNKTDKAGAADILQARVDFYINKKADEERRKREEEARAAARAEAEARERREAEEAAARKAEAEAARARKPENIEAHEQRAEQHAANAAEARGEEQVARSVAQDARAAAAAPTADLVRTRTGEGTLVTAKREPFVEIVDEMKLSPTVLWAFVKTEHKLQALKAWAKITQHKTPMEGAIIEMRDRAVIR